MAKIIFEDKVDIDVSPLPEINKLTAADLNEIKSVVNSNELNAGTNIIINSGIISADTYSKTELDAKFSAKNYNVSDTPTATGNKILFDGSYKPEYEYYKSITGGTFNSYIILLPSSPEYIIVGGSVRRQRKDGSIFTDGLSGVYVGVQVFEKNGQIVYYTISNSNCNSPNWDIHLKLIKK